MWCVFTRGRMWWATRRDAQKRIDSIERVPFGRMRSLYQFRAAQNSPSELEVGFQSSPISVATLGCFYPYPAHGIHANFGSSFVWVATTRNILFGSARQRRTGNNTNQHSPQAPAHFETPTHGPLSILSRGKYPTVPSNSPRRLRPHLTQVE